MGFASDTAQADAELAELTETEKQWKQKLEYATMNPSTTAQELHQLEDQLKRIGFAKEELEERVAANHAHDEDPPEDEAGEEVRIDPLTLQASERLRGAVQASTRPRQAQTFCKRLHLVDCLVACPRSVS
jgi:hypothetical protein